MARKRRFLRWISWGTALPIAIVAASFAVSNRAGVTVALFPLPVTLDVPLYSVGFAAAILGFLAGGLVAWLSGHRWRRRARREFGDRRSAELDVAHLKRKLATSKEQEQVAAVSAVPAVAAAATDGQPAGRQVSPVSSP